MASPLALIRGASASREFWNEVCPPRAFGSVTTVWSALMAEVMIGIDPHKSSHTAVAIGSGEEPLDQLQVHACPSQAEQAAGVGGGLAGAGLGGGGRRRAGASARPAAGRRR